MDEKYADRGVPPRRQVTSLTGMLVPAAVHGTFRERYYRIVSDALGKEETTILAMPTVHASSLFREKSDDIHFVFYEKIVQLINSLNFKILRVGYHPSARLLEACGGEKRIVGLCFVSMLCCLEDELTRSRIWPVMEIDRSVIQDEQFAGFIQNLDYMTTQMDESSMTVNNGNLGEVLYTTKRSAHGDVTDCAAYLLHLAFVRSIGHEQTAYKTQLAGIAAGLAPSIIFNEVIEMKFDGPLPSDYTGKGPLRYMVRITPTPPAAEAHSYPSED